MRQVTLILISILLSFCGKSEKEKVLSNYYSKTCNSIDSIIAFSEKYPDYLKVLSNSVVRFYYSGNPLKARKLLESAKNSEIISQNPAAKEYQLTDWGFYYLWEQKYDSSKLQIDQWQALNHTDTLNHLIGLQLIGNYHYVTNNIDSSLFYFKQGYSLAKVYKQESSIERFANNLGAIAFQSGLYGTAASYFTEAYRINKAANKQNPVLINNLAACYLYENKTPAAFELLSTLTKELDLKNTQYEAYLTRLNYIEVLINLNKIDEAKTYISASNWTDIPQSLKGEYLVNKLKICKIENWSDISTIIETHKFDLAKHIDKLLHKFGSGLIELFSKNHSLYPLLKINELNPNTDLNSLNSKHYYYHLKALEAQNKGNANLAVSLILESNQALILYQNLSDSLKLADLKNKINFSDLEDQLRASQIELSHTTDLNQKHQTIILLISILALIFLGLGYYIYQNRNQKIKLAALEIEVKTKEAAFLAQESKLNSRITSISKIIIEKSKFLAETIKKGPYSNEPEIHAVQRELEQLSMIDNAVNIQAAHEIFEAKMEYLEFSAFKELNETQKRILVLSVENYRAKEIALALNLSYPYVRNVQTKLRKILNSLNLANFSDVKGLIQ